MDAPDQEPGSTRKRCRSTTRSLPRDSALTGFLETLAITQCRLAQAAGRPKTRISKIGRCPSVSTREVVYLTKYDAALEYHGLHRRELRARVDELTANLAESAADGGVRHDVAAGSTSVRNLGAGREAGEF